MKSHMLFRVVLPIFSGLLYSAVYAQESDSTPTGTGENPVEKRPATGSQEVEVNEDIYRQFMELKSARQQRNILPEEAFKPGSGSQKLDELPEESQKHLRNQLREIIVQGAPWQPGDENRVYPYVPSAAAADNQQLQKQEAEAWGELLDSYHKREAQIYENSARTAAAMASGNSLNGTGAESGNQQHSAAQGAGQAAAGEFAESQKQQRNKSQQAENLENTANITSSTGTAGVSQNAMEFLKRMGATGGANDSLNQAENGNNEDTGTESGTGGPSNEPTQMTAETLAEENISADTPSETSVDDATAESLAGTSQNALEFLKQNGEQEGDNPDESMGSAPGESDEAGESTEDFSQASNSQSENTGTNAENSPPNANGIETTAGTSQNALEYLTGEHPPVPPGQESNTINPADMSGTLSIDDLVNARGVGTGSRLTPPAQTGGGQGSGVKPPEEDGDG